MGARHRKVPGLFFLAACTEFMTLYLAWILLYHFQMEWPWYVGAFVAYAGHLLFQIYIANIPRQLDVPPDRR